MRSRGKVAVFWAMGFDESYQQDGSGDGIFNVCIASHSPAINCPVISLQLGRFYIPGGIYIIPHIALYEPIIK